LNKTLHGFLKEEKHDLDIHSMNIKIEAALRNGKEEF
jgi:hypothetical protein